MLLPFLKKKPAEPVSAVDVADVPVVAISVTRLAQQLQRDTSGLGLEAARLRGLLEDSAAVATRQAGALELLMSQLQQILASQDSITGHTDASLTSVAEARSAVHAVGQEVADVVETLQEVSSAAQDITRIALQTRLVAFNASVEAKRAGEAGRGFSVVADAVKDLSTQVEQTSKRIMSTVANLDARIKSLERDISRTPEQGHGSGFQAALQRVEQGVERMSTSAHQSTEVSRGISQQAVDMAAEVASTRRSLGQALTGSEAVLNVSEKLMEVIASCGIKTADTPYIELAQQVAERLSAALTQAVDTRQISLVDLFDEQYKEVAGSSPVQCLTRFNAITDGRFPPVQEAALDALPNVVFCIGVDRNGYIPTHNRKYCLPQKPGDVIYNTANCRWRRIFNDRTGLASARNERPFLLQTYRRDMGGGQFVMLKEAAAPIAVHGRHWGGVRLAYKF